MANTITQKTLQGAGDEMFITRMVHITSDGTQESDLVIFDNSAFINDASKGRVFYLEAWGSSCDLIFEWDQDTDSEILRMTPEFHPKIKMDKYGDGRNPNGAGATGDLLLTTGNLDANDIVTILFVIQQN